MKKAETTRERKASSRNKNGKSVVLDNSLQNVSLEYADKATKIGASMKFKAAMKDLVQSHCTHCKRVSVNLTMGRGSSWCTDCKLHAEYDPVTQNLVPYWTDNSGSKRFDVTGELSCLREGEKLLIQMNAVYIPFVHIKNGTLGLKGHVCSFPQDVQDVCTVLPRLPTETKFVKMIRRFKNSDGEFGVKAFSVRKDKVLDALRWLVKYNTIYAKEVTINESNLEWMGEDTEMELPCSDVSNKEDEFANEPESSANDDMGPAEKQCLPDLQVDDETDHLKTCGIHVEDDSPVMSPEDLVILSEVKKSGNETVSSPWPYVSPEPVNEYDSNEKLFCKAFPWLFPGGNADVNDYRTRKITPTEWAERLLMFEDGRFATDKMWCFFALNYTTRRRNQSSGRFFVDGFHKTAPATLDELKDELKSGNTSFLDKITYYSSRVKGSAGYWRSKRAELYSWINYHVSAGNGAPNCFVTLSCAEYFWPDVLHLLNERLALTGDSNAVSGRSKRKTFII